MKEIRAYIVQFESNCPFAPSMEAIVGVRNAPIIESTMPPAAVI